MKHLPLEHGDSKLFCLGNHRIDRFFNHETHERTRKFNDLETTEYTDYTEKPRRRADNIPEYFMVKKTLVTNDANGSGGSAVFLPLHGAMAASQISCQLLLVFAFSFQLNHMFSDEYYIMHLTPHGWVEGTEKTAEGTVIRPIL